MFFIRRNRVVLFTIASIIGLYLLWMPYYLILTAIGYLLMTIGMDIGLHRYYAHRSFTCSRAKQIFLWICIFISGTGDPIGYARQHRYHHKHSDTPIDNLPVKTNPWKAWIRNNWVDFSDINISDLTNNKFYLFMFKYYFALYFAFIAMAIYIDLYFSFYFFIVPTALVLNISSAVNVFCHKYGYRNFNTPDNTTNNNIINFLSCGAGLHNNHHANPGSYTNKVKPFEVDLIGLFIKYFLKK
jgi:fatty-acid desaturase